MEPGLAVDPTEVPLPADTTSDEDFLMLESLTYDLPEFTDREHLPQAWFEEERTTGCNDEPQLALAAPVARLLLAHAEYMAGGTGAR